MMMQTIAKTIAGALLIICSHLPVHAVTIDALDWAQPADHTGYSYNELLNSFDQTTWAGKTGTIFEGWTWASESEVQALFNTIYGTSLTPDRKRDIEPIHDPASQICFAPTSTSRQIQSLGYVELLEVMGYFSSAARPDTLYYARIATAEPTWFSVASAFVSTEEIMQQSPSVPVYVWDLVDTHIGVWMYRPATQTPEPSSALLTFLGIVTLAGICRRNS